MPAHPEYKGTAKVRVLPPGVCGEDLEGHRPSIGIAGKKLDGYETDYRAAKRLRVHLTTLHKLCRDGKLDHIKVGKGPSLRTFIVKGAVPREKA